MAGLRTPLCDLLGIEYPIVQAPMASTSTPQLAVAVSEAGGAGAPGRRHTTPVGRAPMASTSAPQLAVAVSEAGGLGSLGHAYTQPDGMRAEAAAVRAQTSRPFGVN